MAELFEGANEREHLADALVFTREAIYSDRPFVFLTDATRAPMPSQKTRAKFIRFMAEHKAQLRNNCLGWGVVARERPMRAALKAVKWMIPSPYPVQMFREQEEAKDWLRKKLRYW